MNIIIFFKNILNIQNKYYKFAKNEEEEVRTWIPKMAIEVLPMVARKLEIRITMGTELSFAST